MIALPPLYVICDADICERAGWTLVDFASACLDGGARLLQIRAKHAPAGRLLGDTAAIVARAESAGAVVIVNDRADIAHLAHAGGVHVGQEDLLAASVRRVVGVDAILGLSTHTPEQVDAAVEQAADPATALDYIAIGPVFETPTKVTGYPAVGLDGVSDAAGRLAPHGIPLVAIGGIILATAHAVIHAGATSVAVITDLLATDDPAARVRDYLERLTT